MQHKPPVSFVWGVSSSVLVGRAGRSSEKRQLAMRMRTQHPKVLKQLRAAPRVLLG